jgi:A/G-specific adenine glycosylase
MPELPLPPLDDATIESMRTALLSWYAAVKRPMPWRETSDPYRIWLSEVMLQQTRVDQAEPYYRRFTDRFPTVETLAVAETDDVLKHWEGLGYYARARNLHKAAKALVERHAGEIPSRYDEFIALPGVGPYTAAAVLSIAYQVPKGVVDGNVIRVLSRLFTLSHPPTLPAMQRLLQRVMDVMVPHDQPGDFNQAVMELGATVCTPQNPSCPSCPLKEHCAGWAAGTPTRWPSPKPRKQVPVVEVVVGLLRNERGEWLMQRRAEEAMLGGMWELPGGKVELGETQEEAVVREFKEELGVTVRVEGFAGRVRHAYSHVHVDLAGYWCTLESGNPVSAQGLPLVWTTALGRAKLAIPRATHKLFDVLATPDLFGAP